jgi:pyridoxal phosphate enzyme (YggS family)
LGCSGVIVEEIPARLDQVRGAIDRACADVGRDPGAVNLVCVSKTFSADEILPALKAGQRIFGENRVQESAAKWPMLREQFSGVDLHLIGPLQSNKVALAVDLFDTIQTIDRLKIAAAVADHAGKKNRAIRCFIQVNTGAEDQKAGVSVDALPALVNACINDLGLPIEGLMCIPPLDRPVAPHFALLHRLARDLKLEHLSMGMSADFEQAIGLGATYVRLGSAIFGAR